MTYGKLFGLCATVLVVLLAFSAMAQPVAIEHATEKVFAGISYAPLKKPTPPPPPPPPASGDGVVKRYAVVVGISDYKAVSDLSYCDEDATDWYNYLAAHGYSVLVYGDPTSSYPKYDGLAKEATVKAAIQNMVAIADGDDIIAFVSSGHGTTVSGTTQVLCMWDAFAGENGEDGLITDIELKNMFAPAVAKIFIFLDHCNSGGMNEIMSNSNAANIYMTTTCGPKGYGYDVPQYQNGKWTYWFLEKGLVGQGFTTMESCFSWAYAQYNAGGQDAPRQFDGNTAVSFSL